MRGQSPAHNPGFIRLRAQCVLTICPGFGLTAFAVRGMPRTLAGQPVRRMRRTHAPPSVPRAKTKGFCTGGRPTHASDPVGGGAHPVPGACLRLAGFGLDPPLLDRRLQLVEGLDEFLHPFPLELIRDRGHVDSQGLQA